MVLAGVLLTGCGSSSMSGQAATTLQLDANAVDRAARAGDGLAVDTALRRLRAHVASLRASGDLSAERAARVIAAAAAVALDVPRPTPPASPTPSPRPAVQVKAPAPAPDKHKGKGKKGEKDD